MTNLKSIKEIIEKKAKEKGKSKEELSSQLEEVFKNGFPARFVSVDIENTDKEIKDFCFGYDGKKGLYLYGECGTGKTYSFYAMRKIFYVNGIHTKIYNAISILNEIKKSFGKDTKDYFLDDISEMTGILMIDDIGSEKPTDWVGETFYSIINTRYEKMLPTFFSSNLSLPELADKMGDRIASRIAEMCKIIKLTGEDKRII